jgi:hypothetical protein
MVARFCVATALSATVCLLLWSRVPHELSGPEPIIGIPTFTDFNYMRPFWAYRLVVYAFPFCLLMGYSVLAWRGPLSRRNTTAKGAIRLLDAAPEAEKPTVEASSLRFGVIPRLALPAGVVVAAVAAATSHVRTIGIACGLGYVLAVLATAGLWTWRASQTAGGSWWRAVALTNGVGGATAALLGLWYVSRHTAVVAGGVRKTWPWLPWWLAAVGVGLVLWWTWRQLQRGRSAGDTERMLLTVVVGSIAVFLAISALPGQITRFQGFDDAQHMAGASLLSRGNVPWRDLLFIHGLYQDVLRGSLGFAVFGESIWGVVAVDTVLLFPLCWVLLYLYAAWVSNRNPWFLTLVGISAVSGFLPRPDTRFIILPLALIVLGETLRRRSAGWCVTLGLLLSAQAILIPETSFFAIPAIACVAVADLVHRPRTGIWQALRRTRWCVGAAGVALLCLIAALAATGALGGFIDYYIVFGPGHNVSGAFPFDLTILPWWAVFWMVGIVVALLTIWATVARFRRRGDWESRDWVALALAGFLVFFEEKALGRYDQNHIGQVFTVALPLTLWWLWKLFNAVERQLQQWSGRRFAPGRPLWHVRPSRISFVAPLVVVVCALVWQAPLIGAARGIDTRHRITAAPAPDFPRVGYLAPTAIDLGLLRDLDVALRAYAGNDQPVFDMTNSLGYVYFLLSREPATRFVHVSMAIPPYAQRLLIEDLQRSRPPVVIFDSDRMGMPAWDDIHNDVRHYQVSDYVLDGWVPVLRTHGNLLLVRRDLMRPGLPIPTLSQPPLTTDLWFSGTSCAWGTAPNFLQSQPSGASVTLPVRDLGRRSVVDITGWAADRSTGLPAPTVVMASGGKAVGSLIPSTDRWDVAKSLGTSASPSGFHYSGTVPEGETISAYLLAEDGKLHLLQGTPASGADSIKFPGGRVLATSTSTTRYTSHIDDYQAVQRVVGMIEVPAGLRLADYHLVTLAAGPESLGGGIAITDQIGTPNHYISATSVPRLGANLGIRVGSCLQWRGYDPAKPLYVLQDNGPAVQTVTLSGVRN